MKQLLSNSFSVEPNTKLGVIGQSKDKIYLELKGQAMDQVLIFNERLEMESFFNVNEPHDTNEIISYISANDTIVSLSKSDLSKSYYIGPLRSDSLNHKQKQRLFTFDRGIRRWKKNIRWEKSFDRKALLFYVDNRDQNKNYTAYLALKNFEDGTIVNDSIQTDIKNTDARIKNVALGQDHKMYIFIQIRDAEKSTLSAGRYSYLILIRDLKSKTTKRIKIHNNDIFMGTLAMKLNPHLNKIIVAGFYSDRSYIESQGIVLCAYDMISLNEDYRVFEPLNVYQLRRLGADNFINENKGAEDLVIKEMFLRSDGGVILMTEKQYSSVVNYTNTSIQMMSYSSNEIIYYHYNDINVISINKDGQLYWNVLINKLQETDIIANTYASFKAGVSDKGVYLLFNKSLTKSFALQLDHIDVLGKTAKHHIIKDRALLNSFKQINNNQWLVIIESFGDYRLLKVKL